MDPVDRKKGISLREGREVGDIFALSPIRGIIQEQNMDFMCTEVQGYLPTVVREFYTNMKENQWAETVLETSVMGKQLRITPDSIAHSLQ